MTQFSLQSLQRHYKDYEYFESFYKDSIDQKFDSTYSKQKKAFNGMLDIPWQLLPIWVDKLPRAISESRILNQTFEVGFIIKINKGLLPSYVSTIQGLCQKPEFILFLRNINSFTSVPNDISISKRGKLNVSIETKSEKKSKSTRYLKNVIDDVQINESSFKEEGITIFKHKTTNSAGDDSFYFSDDSEGKQIIERIPPKLASQESTKIVFAAQVVGDQTQAISNYKEKLSTGHERKLSVSAP